MRKKRFKNGETVKNLDQFLTLDLDQFLTQETPNLGPVFNSTADIYIYIYMATAPSVIHILGVFLTNFWVKVWTLFRV